MKKKKLLALGMVAALATTAVVGGTLAYFTDTDVQTNTFTTGNVKIDLWEEFGDANEGIEQLVPGRDVKKEIYVTNEGSEPAYVRILYAIPTPVADKNVKSFNDILHVNFSKASVGGEGNTEGNKYWNWMPTVTDSNDANYKKAQASTNTSYRGWQDNGLSCNNAYIDTIDGEECVVFVVTYMDVLQKDECTAYPAIHKVYMDPLADSVKNADGTYTITKPNFTDKHNGNVDTTDPQVTYTFSGDGNSLIKVIAQATQAEGFDDAYTALNTAFGIPEAGKYAAEWTKAEDSNNWYHNTWGWID